ncbi:MAG: amidase [Alphaproteobacteria bacterium]|jgi:amidase|nr:amidase [Alphaproteobacteria bacterium]
MKPTDQQLRDIAAGFGANLTGEDVEFFAEVLGPLFDLTDAALTGPDALPEVMYPRSPGVRPAAEDNPLNAWYYKTEVKGAATGKLAGRTVAVKDTVLLAGVPLMNGASVMEGYVPEVDATIVTRMLDAGATITGKAVCEYFSLSGSSFTSATGPVHNPIKHGYSAGGSSSGSAALVGCGAVDMSIGGDQAGSIRIPAAFSGVVGMKPTHGLVPYSGIMSMETTIDHIGPMTANVADNALLLEVLAGPDGYDDRQSDVRADTYTEELDRGVEGLRIGVIKEGFGREESEEAVDQAVLAAADLLASLGATVERISVPLHNDIGNIYLPMIAEGMVRQFTFGGGVASGAAGFYPPSLIEKINTLGQRADEWSDTAKALTLLGAWVTQTYGGRIYGKGQNLKRQAKLHFAELFNEWDLLLTPTLPMAAMPLPLEGDDRMSRIGQAWCMLGNTSPYNYTGNPAISVPCGRNADGLPAGLQLIGKHYDERTIYRAAAAFESNFDWKTS